MQDYSNRRGKGGGQLRWKAVVWQGVLVREKKTNKKKTPSVLAVSPTLCALQLYRITLFTSRAGSAAVGESDRVSLQNNHMKTHKSGNLTSWGGGGGGGGCVGWGCLRLSLVIKIQQCHYIKAEGRNEVCIVQ